MKTLYTRLLFAVFLMTVPLITGAQNITSFNYDICSNEVTFTVLIEEVYNGGGVCSAGNYARRTSSAQVDLVVNGTSTRIYDLVRTSTGYSWSRSSGISASATFRKTTDNVTCVASSGKRHKTYTDFKINLPANKSGEGQQFQVKYTRNYNGSNGTSTSSSNTAPNIPRIVQPLSLEPQCDGLELEWGKPSFTCTNASYLIYRDGAYRATVSSFNTLKWTDTNVSYDDVNDHEYEVYVRHNSNVSDLGLPVSVEGNPIKNFISSDYFESVSLEISNFCEQTVRLQWEIDENVDIDYFEVERATDNAFTSDVSVFTVTQTFGTISFENSVPVNQKFFYRVRAFDNCDNETYINENDIESTYFEGPPSKPAITKIEPATDGTDQATITWIYPDDGTPVDYFQVYRDGVSRSDKLPSGTTSFIDDGLSNCVEFEYKVVAGKECFDEANSQVKQQVISFNTSLNGFDDLAVSKYYYNDRVSLEWTVSDDNQASEIVIYRKREGTEDNPEILKRQDIRSSTFDDYDTEAGVIYRYGLLAISCPDYVPSKDEVDAMLTDVGVRSETGIINGKITYEGGNAVEGVRVLATPSDGENRGVSLSMTGNKLSIPLEQDGENWFPSEWSLSFWFQLNGKLAGETIIEMTDGSDYIRVAPLAGGTTSFDEIEYSEETVIVGEQDELIGHLQTDGSVLAIGDESVLGRLNGTNYMGFSREEIIAYHSNDTLYHFVGGEPWMLNQSDQWYELETATTSIPVADSLFGYFVGDTVYESFDSDFVLAFIDEEYLRLARHYNVSYELGVQYASIKDNEMIFAENEETKGEVINDIVYSSAGEPIHMIVGNNVYYVYTDDLNGELVRGARFARKVANDTDPEISFDIFLIEKTVTEEIQSGEILGIISTDQTKVFDRDGLGLTNFLIDDEGIIRTAVYEETTIYVPVTTPSYNMTDNILSSTTTGEMDYLLSVDGETLYSVLVEEGYIDASDFIRNTTTDDFMYYLGEDLGSERRFYKAIGQEEINIVQSVVDTYTKEAYQAVMSANSSTISNSEAVSPELYLGEYNNAMLTYDGADLVFLINGTSVDTLAVGNMSSLFTMADQQITFGGFTGYLDEVLLWSEAKDQDQIDQDFNRYLSGGQDHLVGYWRLDEKVSTNAFDASYELVDGVRTFHGHHALVDIGQWKNIVPEQEDLSFTAYTDEEGNYSIQSIIYAGTGNNFELVPIYGAHSFNPSNKILFIGPSQQIQNDQNFTDISSFTVTGTVKYDPRVLGFDAIDDLSAPNCYVENVVIYVDDQQVVTDGEFVTTDQFGRFEIEVPIGKHQIKISRDNHTFAEATWPPEDDYNFQDHVYDLVFYDNTTRKLIGKVVGGTTEGEKLSGSGESANNIGLAEITLKSIGKTCFETVIATDPVTGEYMADLPPFRYNIVDLSIPSQSTDFNRELRGLAEATIDMSDDDLVLTNEACTGATCDTDSVAYHLIRDFVYRTPAELFVKQYVADSDGEWSEVPNTLGETSIDLGGNNISLTDEDSSLPYDLFLTGSSYTWGITSIEEYVNYDDGVIITNDTIRSGSVLIDNGIADGSAILSLEDGDGTVFYSFLGGEVSMLSDRRFPEQSFTKTVQVIGENSNWSDDGDLYRGIILGTSQDETQQSFYTAAESGQSYQMVDMILRDPPGSQSYTSFNQKMKFTKVRNSSLKRGLEQDGGIKIGAIYEADFPLTGVTAIKMKSTLNLSQSVDRYIEAEETSVISFEETLSLSTSNINANTGAGSDLFVGNSMNIFFSPSHNLEIIPLTDCTDPYECYSNTFEIDGIEYSFARSQSISFELQEVPTTFYYTQRQIEQLIDNIEEDLASVADLSVRSRLENQARIWRSAIAQNEYEKLLAKKIAENIRNGANGNETIEYENISFAYGSKVEKGYELGVKNNLESSKVFNYTAGAGFHIETGIFGVYTEFNFNVDYAVYANASNSAEENTTQSTTIHFQDNDAGDEYSVDMIVSGGKLNVDDAQEEFNSLYEDFTSGQDITVPTESGATDIYIGIVLPNGVDIQDVDNDYKYEYPEDNSYINPVFITLGGKTSCPYEPEESANYLEYLEEDKLSELKGVGIIDDYAFDDTTLTSQITYNSDASKMILNYGTFQRDQPGFRIEPRVQRGVPWDERATFDIILENLNAEDTVRTYKLQVDQRTTGAGPTMRLDGERFIKGTDIALYGGEQLTKTITVRPVADVYDYENIVVYLTAGCQFDFGADLDFQEDIYARDTLTAYFDPVCPKATSISPTEGWIVNDQTGSTLEVEIQEQEYYFENHNKVKLQFKAAYQSDKDWVDVAIWSRDEQEVLDGIAIGENYFDFPEDNNYIVYDWDTQDYTLPDSEYQIRWKYYCTNGLESYSELISGVIDTTSPHAFGKPSPADGVLSPGEEIILTLNETIEAGLVDRDLITVKGKINGTELAHPVSVRLSHSESDQVVINNIQLKQTPITVEMWLRRDEAFATREQELFYHGEASGSELSLRLLADGKLQLTLNDFSVVSDDPLPLDVWSHIAFSIDAEENKAALYQNATLIGFNETFVGIHFADSPILIGGEGATSFTGNIHELRLWTKYMTATDIAPNFYKDLTGREIGLAGYWPLDEGRGELSEDKVQGRNAQVLAGWTSEPSSLSYDFNGANHISLGSKAFADDEDFTMEFWFKSATTETADTMVLVSNGNVDILDWELGINKLGQVYLSHNGASYIVIGSSILDQDWHHIALVVNRVGKTNTYLDSELVSSLLPEDFAGFGGPAIVLGARLNIDVTGLNFTYDHTLSGQMDEFRIWRMARSQEQIERMSYYKLDGDEFGLVCYLPFEEYDDFLRISNGSLVCYDEYELGDTGVSTGESYSAENPEIVLKPYETPVYFNFSVSGNQIIITLDEEDPASVENCTLDFSVRNLVDANGNIMKSPVTWSAYVDRNQVTWTERTMSFEKSLGDPLSFTATVSNFGGEVQDYTIDNLPTWLTASPSTGVIDPDSEVEITFVVNEGLNIGYYQEPIYLRTDFGFNETLLLNLRVSAPLPEDWTFEPTDFEYNMNLIGMLKVEGNYSTDEEDVIGAFVNDSLRGMVNLQYQEVYDVYQAFLTVYSNGGENLPEEIEFRVWDASEGIVLNDITVPEIAQDPVLFVQDALYGLPSAPVTFEAHSTVMSQVDIPIGWKWVSFNLDSDDIKRSSTLFEGHEMASGDRILSMDAIDIYDAENDLWIGSLAGDNLAESKGGLNIEESYRIYSSSTNNLTFSGQPVDPLSTPIYLYARESNIKPTQWNWLSFLGQENMEINEALASINPEEGDIIKSQYGFAIYDPVLKWIGNLTFLSPGAGYMIQLSSDQQLIFPESGLINGSSRVNQMTQLYDDANFDPHRYRDNMSMVVQVLGLDLNADLPMLEVYHEGELRGVAEASEYDGQPIYYLTVYGEVEEDMTFGLQYDEAFYSIDENLSFYPSEVEGSVSNPVLMTFTQEDDLTIGSNIFPNPFDENGVNIVFKLGESGFSQVSVISVTGSLLIDREFIGSQGDIVEFLWDGKDDHGAPVKAGAYILKIQTENHEKDQLLIKQ